MTNSAFFIGAPLEFEQKCLIYPPKVIDAVSNARFNQFLKILTLSQEDLNDELANKIKEGEHVPTPLEFLLASAYTNKEVQEITREAFRFFTKMEITFFFEKKMILFGSVEKIDINNLQSLTEDNFLAFQNMIRQAVGIKEVEPPNPNEDPRITKMKAKMRYRDKIKAKQNAKNGTSFQTILTAICCIGIGITPQNLGQMSYVAVNEIMRMYQEKERYDLDIRSLLAGASSKKIKPKYWIREYDD